MLAVSTNVNDSSVTKAAVKAGRSSKRDVGAGDDTGWAAFMIAVTTKGRVALLAQSPD